MSHLVFPDRLGHMMQLAPVACRECGCVQSITLKRGKWYVSEYHREDCSHQERHNVETEVEVRD